MRILVADCTVDYEGKLNAHLPRARRLIVIKADGT
ncbi:MAG: endonuclease, partial [Acidimicrobiia bacterium]